MTGDRSKSPLRTEHQAGLNTEAAARMQLGATAEVLRQPTKHACYAAIGSVGRSHCTLRVFVCQKYVRSWASFASDQPSGSGCTAAPPVPAQPSDTVRPQQRSSRFHWMTRP